MTLCLLVRHAAHCLDGRVLVGRRDGVPLSGAGVRQAAELAQRLSSLGITHIQSSPRERAHETAAPIARRLGLAVEISDDLDEVDFGAWTGRSFEDLDQDPVWRTWNAERGLARTPGGERMADVQARVAAHLERMRAGRPGARIVMVSHGEPIRAAVLHCTSKPLGAWATVDVPCGSIVAVQVLSTGHHLADLPEQAAA